MPTLEQENAKLLKIDEASYEMYEKTKKETIKAMKAKLNEDGTRKYTDEEIAGQIETIEVAQNDVLNDYIKLGGDPTKLKKPSKKKAKTDDNDIFSEMLKENKKVEKVSEKNRDYNDLDIIPERGSYNEHETYDIIPLPSNGECYKGKLKKLPVSYLTAYDENIIVSPNLYRDNLLIDTILEEKILNDTISPGDLLEGDRDAIVLWLRAGGYGNEYPITATDDVTGEEFESVVDLSKIGFKPFKLKGDENGWFDYTLPVSKHEIKFRFLTHRDNLELKKIEEKENVLLKKERLEEMASRLNEFIDDDDLLGKAEKVRVNEGIRAIEDWSDKISEDDASRFTHNITNRLEASIMSIDGITDRQMIKKFVRNMSVKDSSSLRKYINENEPGVDYNITVEKPASLGGGSMNLFLQLDQFVFLNIT